jgi:hypothetical protein
MQKVLSYLYPNRIQILADLAGFTVEYTNVYQRNVKIYRGIDNTIEFDIKNADQKRVDLTAFSSIIMNLMDASGNALPHSPYTVTPSGTLVGIGSTVIPAADLASLNSQYLQYSLLATNAASPHAHVPLYCDSKFGAVGTIELDGSAMPITKAPRVYSNFTGEVDIQGIPIWHSSAIPCKFYEAVATSTLNFSIKVTGFIGSIWLEATTSMTPNLEAFWAAGKPWGAWTQQNADGLYNGIIPYGSSIPVGDYNYFRVSYQTPSINGIGATFIITVEDNSYNISLQYGGTGYTSGAMIKILGSQVGGVDGTNDIYITVVGVYGANSTLASSYTISEITNFNFTGTAPAGVSGVFIASGTNYSGVVDSITVT